MLELQKQFQNFLEDQGLLKKEEKVLLAVSGGLDSMVLLDLFVKAGHKIGVAHCNYGLRGSDSDQDEQLVTEVAKSLDVECFSTRIDLKGKSIQLSARDQRYAWFRELCAKENYQKIATAHHLNDSIETTLLNLVRGTGIKGLAGIPVRNDEIIRPLLFATKDQLTAYAVEAGVQWREDDSNHKTDYNRNKLRLEVIPKLKEINSSLEKTFNLTKERMELQKALLEDQAQAVLLDYFNAQSGELGLSWIQKRPDLLILNEILNPYGFNYFTVKEVFQSVGKAGKVFETEQWMILMDRESLFIQQIEPHSLSPLYIMEKGIYKVGDSLLEISGYDLGDTRDIDQIIEKNPAVAIVDQQKLSFPWVLRPWKDGDTFQPFGMEGTKKVSDLLIDLKVPMAKKPSVMVLEAAGEIIWVVGYRVSEKVRIDETTGSVVKIQLK